MTENSEKSSQKHRCTSTIWDHFKPVNGHKSGKAQCMHCNHLISYTDSSTSNLWKHIKTHDEVEVEAKKPSQYAVDQSYGLRKRRRLSARSTIWRHFTADLPAKEAQCNYCGRRMSYKNRTTSNLLKHVRNIHSDKLDDFELNPNNMELEDEEEDFDESEKELSEIKLDEIQKTPTPRNRTVVQIVTQPSLKIVDSKKNFESKDHLEHEEMVTAESIPSPISKRIFFQTVKVVKADDELFEDTENTEFLEEHHEEIYQEDSISNQFEGEIEYLEEIEDTDDIQNLAVAIEGDSGSICTKCGTGKINNDQELRDIKERMSRMEEKLDTILTCLGIKTSIISSEKSQKPNVSMQKVKTENPIIQEHDYISDRLPEVIQIKNTSLQNFSFKKINNETDMKKLTPRLSDSQYLLQLRLFMKRRAYPEVCRLQDLFTDRYLLDYSLAETRNGKKSLSKNLLFNKVYKFLNDEDLNDNEEEFEKRAKKEIDRSHKRFHKFMYDARQRSYLTTTIDQDE